MNADTLERLMIDRALGALPADTQALLATFLKHEPRAVTRVQAGGELDETVGLARRALTQASLSAPALPPFPGAELARNRRNRRLYFAAQIAAMAACLWLGLHLGGFGLRGTPAPAPGRALSADAVWIMPPSGAADPTDRSTFWSARDRHQQADQNTRVRQRLVWDSVLKRPRIGDS